LDARSTPLQYLGSATTRPADEAKVSINALKRDAASAMIFCLEEMQNANVKEPVVYCIHCEHLEIPVDIICNMP